MNFTIRSERIRDALIDEIMNLPIEPLHRVNISTYRQNKSQEQLGYLWGCVLPAICQHVEDSTGDHYTTDDVYGWMVDEYAEDRVVTINGKPKVVKHTASKMNTKEMHDFIERVIQHAAMNMGLAIPEAE